MGDHRVILILKLTPSFLSNQTTFLVSPQDPFLYNIHALSADAALCVNQAVIYQQLIPPPPGLHVILVYV